MSDASPTSSIPNLGPPTFRNVPWRFTDLLLTMLPWIAARIVPFFDADNWAYRVPIWAYAATLISMQLWTIAVPLLLFRYRVGRLPRTPGARRALIDGLLAVPCLFGIWTAIIIAAVLWDILVGAPQQAVNDLDPVVRTRNWTFIAIVAWFIAVLAPIGEEMGFRGMLFNWLRIRMPRSIAILIQGVLFGLMHPYGPLQTTIAAMLGVFAAVLYEWRRTLTLPIVVHGLHNLAVLAVVYVSVAKAGTPMIGIEGQPGADGCRITRVIPASGADVAGVRVDDVVVAIDDQPVTEMLTVTRTVRAKRVGQSVILEIDRDGRRLRVEVAIGRREDFQ